MAQQTINIGASPNDGTGTPLRTAFQYTNSNFSELYTAVGPSGNNIVCPGSATITGDLTVDTSTLKVDSANNRVGINTASPALPFVVSNAGAQGFEINPNGSIVSGGIDILSYNRSTSLYKGAGFAAESYLFRVGTVSATDAMTLNSTGLGVGGSPLVKLSVVDTVNTFAATFRGNLGTDIVAIGTTALGASINAYTAGFGAATNLVLQPNGGNVGIGVTPSAGGGCLQLSSGITFPATQVASSDANTLDDYEEGTFTPGITFGGANVGMTGTFAGRYTKVGRAVTINGIIALTAKGSSTGIAKISGLPFTSANAPGEYTAISIRLDRVSFADYPCGYVGPNSSVVELENTTNAGTVSNMTDSNFINTSVVIVNFTYTV